MDSLKMKKHHNRRHTGTGVLIITNYFNKPYILLGQDSWKSLNYSEIAKHAKIPIYEEFGGGIQTRKISLEKNALFELREETANLFNMPEYFLQNCPYFDIPYKENRMYRIYLLYIENIWNYMKYFNKNMNLIKENRVIGDKSDKYLEMENIRLVSLNEVSKMTKDKNNFICFNSVDNIYNNLSTTKNYRGILHVNDNIFINSRLVYFLNSKYNNILGIKHIENYYNKSVLASLFPNNNVKATGLIKHNKQNNEKYNFLEGTLSIFVER